MGRTEIIKKLAGFLDTHDPLSEECQVVYLMVEIRKVIDHEKSDKTYPLLKFYGDWTVHTEKDRITPEIKRVIEAMHKTAETDIVNPASRKAESPIMQFAYMDGLGQEMKSFLENHGADPSLAQDKNKWLEFVKLLVKILENQPINNPIDGIVLFSFIPATERCVRGVIYFKEPIEGHDHYEFAKAY